MPLVAGLPDTILRYRWTVTAVTIAVLAVVSVLAGWWLSGRVLRPLHRITATARRLSVSNLHERIALAGPGRPPQPRRRPGTPHHVPEIVQTVSFWGSLG